MSALFEAIGCLDDATLTHGSQEVSRFSSSLLHFYQLIASVPSHFVVRLAESVGLYALVSLLIGSNNGVPWVACHLRSMW
jgi:hypothetical protein